MDASARVRTASLALLALAVLATFAGVARSGWIPLDDPLYVYRDPQVVRGWTLSGAFHFLTHPHANNWHPLTSWSHMLDVELFGLAARGPHLVNLALHALDAVLVAWVLAGLTGAWWRSVLVAALFALHPLRVESVAWVSERKDVLGALWFLIAIDRYRCWAETPRRGLSLQVGLAFLLGLLTKPMVVTLPCVLVLLDVWPLGRLAGTEVGARAPRGAPRRTLAGLVTEKWPLFLLALAASVVTFLVQRSTGAVVATATIPLGLRVANALLSYGRYVAETVWPTGLTIFYPYDRALPVAAVIGAAAGLLAVTVLAARLARAVPALLVGWLWYLGTLVPVIGIVQVGLQAHADRYTYLPSIGLLVAMVWGVAALVERRPVLRRAAVAVAALAITVSIALTARQVSWWRDARTLFEHALALHPGDAVAHEALGDVFLDAGDPAAAIPHLEAARAGTSDVANLESNLGGALGALGRYDQAIPVLRGALARHPTADLHHNLAGALAGAGRIGEAIAEYRAALRMDPASRESLVGLASALGRSGRTDEAQACLDRAVALARSAGEIDEADLYARELARYRLGASVAPATEGR